MDSYPITDNGFIDSYVISELAPIRNELCKILFFALAFLTNSHQNEVRQKIINRINSHLIFFYYFKLFFNYFIFFT